MRAALRFLLAPLAAAAFLLGRLRALLCAAPRTPEVAAELAAHFKARGLHVEHALLDPPSPGAVWTFELRFKERPRPIVVSVYLGASYAERALRSFSSSPRHAYARRNGHFIMALPYWNDSVPELPRAIDAFGSFTHDVPTILEP
jgi:hypothetical protein